MRKTQFYILVSVLLVLAAVQAGCGNANESSSNNPQTDNGTSAGMATDVRVGDQNSPGVNESSPSHIVLEDDLQDAYGCVTGESPADLSLLSPAIDVTHVEAWQINKSGVCYYKFDVEFGELSKLSDRVNGVFSFLPLDFTDQVRPDFPYPDDVDKMIFKWLYKGLNAKKVTLIIERIDNGMVSSEDLSDERFTVTPQGNTFIVDIPCDLVPAGSGWYLSIEDETGLYCDFVGFAPGGGQSLELPVGEE